MRLVRDATACLFEREARPGRDNRTRLKEVVVCSIAQVGVLVFRYDNSGLIRSIISNLWGARHYKQSDAYKNAQTAQALSLLYPNVAEPLRQFKNPVLAVFANAIWHCGSAAEVCTVLNEAAAKLPELERTVSGAHRQRVVEEPPKKTVDEVVSAYGALIEKISSRHHGCVDAADS